MKVHLGYVSIPITIGLTASKTITYTNYKKEDNGLNRVFSIIKENLDTLEQILKYNIKNNIHFYRMTSKLIPLSTIDEIMFDYIEPFKEKYKQIGKIANNNSIRIDMHPDQFCILNSTNKKVVENSIKILNYHKKLFDAFSFFNPKLILHVGSNVFGKEKSIERFKKNFCKLDKSIKEMIIIENDDKVFNIKDVLSLSKDIGVPVVLDYHHYVCNNEGENLEDYLKDIFLTWKDMSPKVHFSSPKSKLKSEFRSHNDYIDPHEFIKFLEICKKYTDELYIMIEAKKKDEALFRLVRALKYMTNYKFIDDTTFIV